MRKTKPNFPSVCQPISYFFLIVLLCSLSCVVNAQGWTQNVKKLAADGASQDNLGNSISISGDYLAIAAWTDDDMGTDAGTVYLYARNQGGTDNWGLLKKITASNGANNDHFGSSLALDGDYLLVGAVGSNSTAGSAYLFKKDQGGVDNWGQLKILTASDDASGDRFGASVAIHNDYALIGADGNDDAGMDSGSAYLFQQDLGGTDNWGQLKKLTASSAAADDEFGNSVAISEEYAIVGAQGHVNDLGTAFLFQKDEGGTNNWGQIHQLYAGDAFPDENFGSSVSISGEQLVIGAKLDNFGVGAAYVFFKDQDGTDQWGQVKKLIPEEANADDFAGQSVFIDQNQILVGAPGDSTGRGAVYVFSQNFGGSNNWGQTHQLIVDDRAVGDSLGVSVAMDGIHLVAGAVLDDDMGLEAGSGYIFKRRCDPTLAAQTNAEGVLNSGFSELDAQGWTHYCSCDGQLLLSIEKGSSGAVIRDDGISIAVETPTATYHSMGCNTGTCFINNSGGAVVFNRKWEVSPFTQPSSPLKVRFYFTVADYNAVNAELVSNTLNALGNVNQLSFYKVNNVALGVHPAVEDVGTSDAVVIQHGANPSLSRWILGTQGPTDYYAEFEVSSFSGGGGGAGSGGDALPVELLSFTGKKEGHLVDLAWLTASEKNNLGFTVEHSKDLEDWTILHFVEGQGTTFEQQAYALKNIRPALGDNYFRLKQEDFNGTSTYSEIVHLYFETAENKAQIRPNPVLKGQNFSVQFFLEQETKTKISLYNNGGLLVHQQELVLGPGGNQLLLDTREFPAGVYHLVTEVNQLVDRQKMVILED